MRISINMYVYIYIFTHVIYLCIYPCDDILDYSANHWSVDLGWFPPVIPPLSSGDFPIDVVKPIINHPPNHQSAITGWWFGTSILFSHILGIIIPIDVHIFQRGGPTTNQIIIHINHCESPLVTVLLVFTAWNLCNLYVQHQGALALARALHSGHGPASWSADGGCPPVICGYRQWPIDTHFTSIYILEKVTCFLILM